MASWEKNPRSSCTNAPGRRGPAARSPRGPRPAHPRTAAAKDVHAAERHPRPGAADHLVVRHTGGDAHRPRRAALHHARHAGHLEMVAGHFMSAIAPDPHQVLVFLRHPNGRRLGDQARRRVGPGRQGGNRRRRAARVGEGACPPPSRGKSWSLAYRIEHFVPGTKVLFAERGTDSTHVLGTVGKASRNAPLQLPRKRSGERAGCTRTCWTPKARSCAN